MRGVADPRLTLLSDVSLEEDIAENQLLREILVQADVVLALMDKEFPAAYAHRGRPMIPLEMR